MYVLFSFVLTDFIYAIFIRVKWIHVEWILRVSWGTGVLLNMNYLKYKFCDLIILYRHNPIIVFVFLYIVSYFHPTNFFKNRVLSRCSRNLIEYIARHILPNIVTFSGRCKILRQLSYRTRKTVPIPLELTTSFHRLSLSLNELGI